MDDLFATETRILRQRIAALEDRLDRLAASGAGGTHRMVGRVFSQGAIPTTAGKFYACHPVTVTGPEVEGGTPVRDVDTAQAFLVDLLGGTAAVGDDLVCRRVRHRWVARPGGTAACGSICIRVHGCTNSSLFGATATLSQGGTPIGSVTSSGGILSASVTVSGSGYTSIPAVSTSGGGGSGAALQAQMSADAATIVNAGTGYAVNNILTVAGGTTTAACSLRVASVASGAIASVAIANGGSYTDIPTGPVSVTGGAGTGATFTLTWRVLGALVNNPGTGFTSAPTLVFSSGAASGTTTIDAMACFSVSSTGTYTYSISKARYITATGSVAHTTCNAQTTTATLGADTSTYVCCTQCDTPYPKTLFLTDSVRTIALTWDAVNAWWSGTSSRTLTGIVATDGHGNCTTGTVTDDITWQLYCPTLDGGVLKWTLFQYFHNACSQCTSCAATGSCFTSYFSTLAIGSNTFGNSIKTPSGSPACGSPLNVSFDFSVINACNALDRGVIVVGE